MRKYFDRIMARCVVVVGLRLSQPWQADVYGPAYNAAMQEEAQNRQGEHQDTVYVDWEAQSRPLSPVEDYFTEDDLHTTDAGAAVFREAIADGVDECAAKIEAQQPAA